MEELLGSHKLGLDPGRPLHQLGALEPAFSFL